MKASLQLLLFSGAKNLVLPPESMLAWWNANRGVYSDTARTIPAAHGGTVAGWNDQGPSGYHVTQGTPADCPLYVASLAAFNNNPAVQFVSSDFLGRTGLSAGVVANLSVYSIFIVYQTITAALGTFYSEGKSDNTVPYVSLNYSATNGSFDCRDDASVRAVASGGTLANASPPHIMTLRRISATSWSLRLDGTQIATDAHNVAATTINRLSIGCYGRAANAQFFTGYIAQVALYSADNYATIEPALANFYGIKLP